VKNPYTIYDILIAVVIAIGIVLIAGILLEGK